MEFECPDAVGGPTPITKSFAADDVNNWQDALGALRTLGATPGADSLNNWGDIVAFNRTPGITPITKSFTADPWQNTSDSPTFTQFFADHFLFLPDAWQNLADSFVFSKPTVGAGDIQKSFSDDLNLWADQRQTVEGYLVATPDTWGTLADQAAASFTTAAAITDPWGNLADQLTVSLAKAAALTDSWANLADQAPAVSFTLSVAPATDS